VEVDAVEMLRTLSGIVKKLENWSEPGFSSKT